MWRTDIDILKSCEWAILKWIYLKIDTSMILHIDDYYLLLNTCGDCCSETYISDIVKNISLKEYPTIRDSKWWKKIVSVDELKLQEWEYEERASRQDEDEIYWIKISLECEWDEPDCITIVYRNSSNWYYGWWMDIQKFTTRNLLWYSEIKYDFHNPF